VSWLVTAALPAEAELVAGRLRPAPKVGGRAAWRGELGGREMWLVMTGMGLVNAAQAVTAAIERLAGVEAVVNLGCAGAYAAAGLAVGQAALASEVVLADHGIRTARRLHGLEKTGVPLATGPDGAPLYHRFAADPGLNRLLGRGLPRGVFCCVVQVSGDEAAAEELAGRWGAVLEDMESGAAALVAAHYRLPFACLRGVSNLAGARQLDLAAGARAAERAFLAALGEEG
jgi:futalosine hydrolase